MEYSVNMLKRENRICGIESNEQLCHAKENPSSLGLNRDQKHRGSMNVSKQVPEENSPGFFAAVTRFHCFNQRFPTTAPDITNDVGMLPDDPLCFALMSHCRSPYDALF